MRIEETAVFNCPIDVLFSYIEKPEKQKRWMKGLLSNESTSPDRSGVGSTFHMKIQEGRKVADYDGEVTAYDRPKRLEILFWGAGLPKDSKMRVDYCLGEMDGRTKLEYTCTLEAPKMGWFMRLLMGLFKIFGRMHVRSLFKTLRQEVETAAKAA
jgi:uncharacterized protein YndB with AHSA1/START domain